MHHVLKSSLISGLLMVAVQSSHANDSVETTLQDPVQQSSDQSQTILPPPSPFFSSKIVFTKLDINSEEYQPPASETSSGGVTSDVRVQELETALKDTQAQSSILIEELHATAKNSDFENEMYEKTVSQLQEKLAKLSLKNEDLSSKLVDVESTANFQQGLLSTPKQESTELNDLKNSYQQRNEEIASLKRQIGYFEVIREQSSTNEATIQTLGDAYTAKSEEAEKLKTTISENEELSKTLEEKLDKQSAEVATLKERISSEEQTQAELSDLQNEATELSESNQLLKTKIVELESTNSSLNSQLTTLQQDASEQTQKLGLLDQSTAELESTKSAYKERNDEVLMFKSKLLEEQEVSKSLNAVIETLKAESSQNLDKLALLEKSTTELESLKSAYEGKADEVIVLQSKLKGAEVDSQLGLAEIENLKAESNKNTENLGLLEQAKTELDSLKSTYKGQGDEVIVLQSKLKGAEVGSQLLLAEIETLKAESSKNTEKLGLLAQSTTDLESLKASNKEQEDEAAALKSAYNEINDEVLILKSKLQEEQEVSKSLNAVIETLKAESSQNLDKLGLLERSTTELDSLKSAYKGQGDEVTVLQSKLKGAEVGSQLLLAEIETLKAESNKNNEKLGLMAQSTTDFESLKGAYKSQGDEVLVLQSKLKDAEDGSQSLLAEIETLKTESNKNSEKLGLMAQSTTDFESLKSAYKSQGDEVLELQSKLKDAEDGSQSLLVEIETLKTESNKNTEKLGLLAQSTTELESLKVSRKEQADQAAVLKEKIAGLDEQNKTFQTQVEQFEIDASQSKQNLGLLDQTSAELASLKNAYKERNDESTVLKEKVQSLDADNKKLLTENDAIKANASQQNQKLALLAKESAELDGLKSAFKDRNDENVELKKRLFDTNKSKTDLSNEFNKLKSDSASLQEQVSKIDGLKSELEVQKNENSELTVKLNELTALKSSLDSTNNALANLQKKLDESENISETLNSKIKTFESDASKQQSQLTALSSAAEELVTLKSAYKDLKQQNAEMDSEFTQAMQDADNDGVVDKLDQCQSSPLGSSVDNKGCPEIADADGDKVPDANDLCPATGSGMTVNEFGCEANQNMTLKGVNFTIGSDKLTASSLPIIKAAADTLSKNPSIKVEVAGYTDDLGVKAINKKLSKRRANSVAIELIKLGVDTKRISIKGYGESNPITSNKTEAGRLSNRRVELKIR